MFEKVSPSHPDKLADRLSGAIVDLAYERSEGGFLHGNPRIAVEVLAGHNRVDVQIETSLGRQDLRADDLDPLIHRLFGERVVGNVLIAPQDAHLSENQTRGLRCGDNGIFRGCPPTEEQKLLTSLTATIYENVPYDGKYLAGGLMLNPGSEYQAEVYGVTICQSHATEEEIDECMRQWEEANFGEMKNYPFEASCINPLGPWTGGIDVDCGCTNRKLGSDMGDGVTGGGLMGKDVSKADVSVNIVCYLKAVASGQVVTACCSIGDESVTFQYADGKTETETFADIVEMARLFILFDCNGSFEEFAKWGLIRPKE